MLYNIHTASWDNELCDLFNVNQNQLPQVKNSFDQFGKTNGLSFLPDGIPITGILGDQQSALFGQAGYNKGDLKCTYGTGAFMLLNTGSEAVSSKNGLLTTVAYGEDGKLQYALEGSTYIAGAAVQWLRDNLNLFENAPEIENLAKQVSNLEEMEHVLFLPFFTGIGSPHWKSDAKAAIIGLTRDTNKSHLSRACLEGIAFSINDLVSAFENDSGEKIQELKVDGGAVANDLLMNMQSSLSKLEIIRPEVIETTAYGAALAAAIGNGLIEKEKIEHLWKKDQSFTPDNNLRHYFESKNNYWKNSINKLF
jgi:glycerol kinase